MKTLVYIKTQFGIERQLWSEPPVTGSGQSAVHPNIVWQKLLTEDIGDLSIDDLSKMYPIPEDILKASEGG